MQNKRNFNPMSAPGLSDEARKAVNAAFDAMSTWRIETAKQQREEQRASHREAGCRSPGAGMAGANRRCHPHANAEHHQNADPNDGSDDGRLGGADQITDDRLAVGDAVKAKVPAQRQPPGSWPNAGALQMAAANPLQFWMQFAEQWQKACTDAMAFWARAGKPYDDVRVRRH
jgi:hypothetical protein